MARFLSVGIAFMALAVAIQAKDLRCFSCSSYMSQCKDKVDNGEGDVFKTRCNSKCFARVGEDGATYRGCFDGFREIGDLVYEYNGCQNQTWNNRALRWCLCDTDLCNGESLDKMARSSGGARSYKYEENNYVDNYYTDDKDEYDQYYKRGEEPRYTSRPQKKMDKFAKMGHSNQGEPYENIVETNYGYDVAHNIAPLPPSAFKPRKAPQDNYYQEYDDYRQVPSKQDYVVEKADRNPYVDPRFRERPTFYVEEKVPEAGYYQRHYPTRYEQPAPRNDRYYEEDVVEAPSYYEEERRPKAFLNDEGVYKHNYVEEPARYAPEPREGPSYVEETGYNEPVSKPQGSKQRAEEDTYASYGTDSAPSYEYDTTYDDVEPSASTYSEFTTKVQKVSPQLASQIKCTKTGYYQDPNNCKQFVACLLDPHSKTPIMHLMECPNGLVWDNAKKICMEYSTTCDVEDYYGDDYTEGKQQDTRYAKKEAPSKYVEENEQDSYSLDTEGYQQAVAQPDILTYYPDDDNKDQYLSNDDFKNYNDEEKKYESNTYADEYH